MSRSLETFQPARNEHVTMYACGPTIYDFAHIGNWRAFVFYDLVKRYLTYRGYGVYHVMNITDVDDKIIRKCMVEKKTIAEFTTPFLDAFLADSQKLRILPPNVLSKATEHIDDMVELIQKLKAKGLAYTAADNSTYFSIEKFPPYGELAHLDKKGLKPGARVNQDEYEKQSVADFALWKAFVPEDGQVYWDTPLGKGRPGWHIECSAMAIKYLGESIDMHLGGVDLVFPHHQNEIAQSEGASGKTFSKYWLHCNHLLINGEKMSKSKGNFFTLRDLEKNVSPIAVRFVLLNANYRQSLNFTLETARTAENTLARINDWISRLQKADGIHTGGQVDEWMSIAKRDFESALDNDLNTPNAFAALFEFMKKTNGALDETKISRDEAKRIFAFLHKIDSVLGIMDFEQKKDELSAEEKALIDKRSELKAQKKWKEADAVRDHLAQKGILLLDTKDGVTWKRQSKK